jgi:ADP-ribose pyrophosphatase
VIESVKTPASAEPKTWTVVRRKAAVVIAPMTADGKVLLVREERIPIRATTWQMPAGQIDDKDEPDQKEIEATVLRELREETGYELEPKGELVPLGFYFTSPGFTDEHCYLYLARFVRPAVGYERQEGEGILERRAFSAEEVVRMISANDIRDANTLSMCARLAAHGFFLLSPAASLSI